MNLSTYVTLLIAIATMAEAKTAGAQTTKVTVRITGLAALADGPLIGQLHVKTVLLLNARVPVGPHGIAHYPVVAASMDYQPTTTDRSLTSIKDGASKEVARYVELNGDPLKFIGVDASKNPLAYKYDPPKAPPCPDDSEKTSLYFLTRKHSVVPAVDNNGRDLDDTDLDDDHVHPKALSSTIAGWLEIRYGKISASLLNPIVWDFKVDPASYGSTNRQLIAQEAKWEFSIDGDTLVLQSFKDPSKAEEVLRLKADANGQIELIIANAPKAGIEGLFLGVGGRHEPEDPHFTRMYEYFKPYLNDAALPRYEPVVAGVCVGGRFSSLPCDIYHFVKIPLPSKCQGKPAVGETNCGPPSLP